jgi:hypothetical protein
MTEIVINKKLEMKLKFYHHLVILFVIPNVRQIHKPLYIYLHQMYRYQMSQTFCYSLFIKFFTKFKRLEMGNVVLPLATSSDDSPYYSET